MPAQSRYWCFTANNPGPEPLCWPNKVSYAVYQLELADSGTPHLQGYLELTTKCIMTTAKNIIKKAGYDGAHLQARAGTAEQARQYCMKSDTQQSAPVEHGTWQPTTPGARSDLLTMRDSITEADGNLETVAQTDNFAIMGKYMRAAQFVSTMALKNAAPKWRTLKVIVLWGSTGTGKTREAMTNDPYRYSPSGDSEWWDGYTGQNTLLIDEFYGQMKMSRILELLDGYQVRLPIKGGFVYANWTTVYITSNQTPDEWYTTVPEETKQALLRRITEIRHLGPEDTPQVKRARIDHSTFGGSFQTWNPG